MNDQSTVSFRAIFAGRRGSLALGLLLLEFTTAVQTFFTATVLPVAAQQLHGARFYGVALSGGTVALFVALPFAGTIIQRWGARRALRWAAVLYVVGIAISAASPTILVYALGRFTQGLAAAVLAVFGLSAVVSEFPQHLHSRLIALVSAMWIVPGLVGPAIAAALTQLVGWRWAIASLIVPLAIGRLITAPRLAGDVEQRIAKRQKLPVATAAALTIGIALVLVGGSVASPEVIALAVAGLALTLGAASRILPAGTLLARPGRPAAVAAFGLLTCAFFGVDSLITLYTVEGLGRPIGVAAPALTAGTVCWALAAIAQPRVTDHFGGRSAPALLLGASLLVAGEVLLLLALIALSPEAAIGVLWSAWILGGLGMGLTYPILTTAVLADVKDDMLPPAQRATAVVLAESLGSGLGLAIGGSIVAAAHVITTHYRPGIAIAYGTFAGIAVLMGGLAKRLSPALPPDDTQAKSQERMSAGSAEG
jgi:MFS family permease